MRHAAETLLRAKGGRDDIVRRAHVDACHPAALSELANRLGPGPFAHIYLFVCDDLDFDELIVRANVIFGGVPISACTTAGEISPDGYSDACVLAIALPTSHFAVETLFVPDLDAMDQQELVGDFIRKRNWLAAQRPSWAHEFAFTLIDGLTMQEEGLMSALTPGLGGMPLFGGSAGDGCRFEETYVAHNGQTRTNAAVVSVIRTSCPVKVFSLNHFEPTNHRMIVTQADPVSRTVYKINAEPAVQEYARALDMNIDELGDSVFAAHPVVVRIGNDHHVRAIKELGPDGSLIFASAIDEGLVLILAEPSDIAMHLRQNLSDLSIAARPDAILACDCLWRRTEANDRQMTREISKALAQNNVLGFTTYGEQIDGLHVNHTMTGVAIYPPMDQGESH